MFTNYIKMAWRNLRKESFYSVINILGLAIATAVFLLIVNFVKFEYSYESFHKKADDIYRVTYDLYQGSKYLSTDCETHPPLAPLLKEKIPEVLDYVRIQDMDGEVEIKHHNQFYRVDKTYAADASIFNIFSYEFIEGNKITALKHPMEAVLTQSQCMRIFGSSHVIGKSIRIGKDLYSISGVIKDLPANTHLKIDMLLSFSSLTAMGWDMNSWNGNNNYTYLQLAKHVNLKAFNEKLKAFSKIMLKDKVKENIYVAEPIKTIHLYSHKGYEPEVNGDAKSVRFMLISGILILLVGSVNYVNLTTARSAQRIKEIGMRKLLGSSRGLLIIQVLIETILVNVFAMILALLIVWTALPFYFQLIGRPIEADFFGEVSFGILCGAMLVFNCLLSGLYPAIRISATKPIRVINRTSTGSRESDFFRKALVVGQFATALIVLSASFIVYRQLDFMQQQNLGIDANQVLVVKAPTAGEASDRNAQTRTVKNALLELPGIVSVSASGALPGVSHRDIGSSYGISRYGSKEGLGYNFYLYGIDDQFIPTMEIKLEAGENFKSGSAKNNEVIINEFAAHLLGFTSPLEAVGQKLNYMGNEVMIKGVMKDYHQLSMKEAILPIIHNYTEQASYYSIKLNAGDPKNVLVQLQSVWKENYPGYPLDYRFLDDMFDQQYKNEQRFGKIVGVFSFLTLMITCLGILGLTAYNINVRTREIGIRKVLGASVSSIVQLLSFDLVKLIVIAIIIATPIAWYFMNLWLDDFAYRLSIQWWVFAATGMICIAIALFTLSFQSIKAALMKPVSALKINK